MTTKIGLPENRKRLKGAGIEHARSASFDAGYNAGFDAGVEYYRKQTAEFIHQLGVNSLHYDGYNALVHAYQAVNIVLGEKTWSFMLNKRSKNMKKEKSNDLSELS
jgi:hypothetical protein